MTCCSSQSPRDADPGAQTLRPDHVWRPFELLAMVLGFIFFWPVGLAVIGFKIWQRRSAYPGDLSSFLRERAENLRNACGGWRNTTWNSAAGNSATWHSAWETPDAPRQNRGGWSPFGGMRPTGNRAFDEWRDSELARLEEERRKLEEAERAFAVHIEELRRARDREEFERFMKARHNNQSSAAS